jgi:hypothetical protein
MNNKLTYTLMMIIATASIATVAGCSERTASASPQAQTGAPPPAVQGELRDKTAEYLRALQASDAAAVDKLISTELRTRIETRGTGPDFATNLKSFVAREHAKLARSVAGPQAQRAPIAASSAQLIGDGAIAAVTLAVGGATLPKPIYLVQENGGFKVNVVQPQVLEGNTYVIQNDDGVARSFSCSGGRGANVAPGQTASTFCDDACGFFDGTRFNVAGATADCDFNTFGVDMFIRGNAPVCNDRC